MPDDYNDLMWNETNDYVEFWRVNENLIVELQLGNRG